MKTRTEKQFLITGIHVIAYFEAHLTNSFNDVKQESGLYLGTIHNILNKPKLVPYRYRATQLLVLRDQERYIQLCKWFVNETMK